MRDAGIWDPKTFDPDDRCRYLYCFLGKPGFLGRVTNVQKAPLTIRIRGEDFLTRMPPDRLFLRKELATVVVIRGDYVGPALIDPPPL